jgi:hypothetical protein
MRLAAWIRLGCAALALSGASALAELRVRIAETHPPSPAVLARDEPMYLKIEYSGAENVTFWARPHQRGEPLKRGKFSPSRPHSGSGSALGWFSLDGADAVDEIRIVSGGGSPYRETVVLRHPIDVRGTGVPGGHRPRPAWAEALAQEEERIHRQRMREEMSRPPSVGSTLLLSGFTLAVLGLLVAGIAGPAWGVWKWRGPWRLAASLCALPLLFTLARIVVDTARDPTSHNLWPFEILMVGGAGLAAFAVVALVKRLKGRGT